MKKKIIVFGIVYLILTVGIIFMMRHFDNLSMISNISFLGIIILLILIIAYLIFNKKRKQTLIVGVPVLVMYAASIFLIHLFNPQILRDTYIPISYKPFNWEHNISTQSSELNNILEKVEDIDRLQSIAIIQNGKLKAEKYYHGASENNAFNVRSVTKTVISLLIGIAIEEKVIDSLTQPIIELFPEYKESINDKRKLKITVKDLLTMKAGFAYDCYDCTEYLFTQMPLNNEPGKTFSYSNVSFNLLSEIIHRQSKKNTIDYATEKLFKPLGIQTSKWNELNSGTSTGADGLYLATRDMARIGYLMLNNGEIDSLTIVPKDWIKKMLIDYNQNKNDDWVYGTSDSYIEKGYGLGCWITDTKGHKMYTARGHGGQMIHVIPDKKLVIAITQKDLFMRPNEHIDNPDLLFKILDVLIKEIKI